MLMSTGTNRNGRPGHANEYAEPEPEPEARQMQIEDYPEYMPGGGEP
jgi:hypothetical protein